MSWLWVGAVALIVALVVVGLNYWRNQPQPVAVVSTATPTAAHTLTPMRTATTALAPTSAPVASPTPLFHEVQSGETLIYIASYYGTAVDELMQANELDETSARMLLPGQRLLIPSTGPVGGPGPNAAAPPRQVIHEVKSGETLISIAIDYDTTVEAIMDASDLDSPDLIYEGQQLTVPLMPSTATPTLTPMPTPSSTPGPPYAAPHLLSPSDGALFQGEEAAILLSWTSVAILREDQVYLVELETPAQVMPITYATQSTSWRLPSELRPTGRRRTMTWRVTVVQRTNSTSDALPKWEPVSLPSETRHFVWG